MLVEMDDEEQDWVYEEWMMVEMREPPVIGP